MCVCHCVCVLGCVCVDCVVFVFTTCFVFIVTDVLRHRQRISYKAWWYCVGVCDDGSGEVTLQDSHPPHSLYLYSPHQEQTTVMETGGVRYDYTAVSSDAVYGQEYGDGDTTHKHSRPHGTHSIITHTAGLLIGFLSPDAAAAYAREEGSDRYYIIIQRPEQEVTLRPPGTTWRGDGLSVCSVGGGQIVVTSLGDRTLHSFSADGET